MSNKFNEYEEDYEIKEERGWLPAWWVWLILGGFVVSLVYSIWFHGIESTDQSKEYKKEIALFEKTQPKVDAKLAADGSNPFRDDAAAIARGEKSFQGLCAACHKPDMSGLVGPNLADAKWLHGDSDKQIFEVIMKGVQGAELKQTPIMGPMPAHEKSLGAQKVLEVMAFVASKNPTMKAK